MKKGQRQKWSHELNLTKFYLRTMVNSCIWVQKNLTIQGLEVFMASSRLACCIRRAEPASWASVIRADGEGSALFWSHAVRVFGKPECVEDGT